MTTKPIAADELNYMFHEELALLNEGRPLSVAIVPDPEYGWSAMTSHKDQRRHPRLAKQIAKIEAALRPRYRLKDS